MSYFRIGGSSGGGLIDNISANKVIETSTRVFVTPEEKAQITDNKQRIETLEQSGGGIDLTQIVDGVTIDLVGDKLVVKNVEGLVIGIVDINNWLSGTERNIQDQIDDINTSLVALTSGMRFRGKVATRADLSTVTSTENGDLVVVLSDEQQNDGRSLYVFSDDLNEWDFIGEFIFSDKFIELQDTPNNYTGHNGKIVRVDETNEKLVFDVIQWSEIEGKPNSTPTQIDNAVTKAHEHTNKSVLDKFSEDAEGKPLFDGKSIGNGGSADLSELEQKVNNNTTAITNLEEDLDRHLADYGQLVNTLKKENVYQHLLDGYTIPVDTVINALDFIEGTVDNEFYKIENGELIAKKRIVLHLTYGFSNTKVRPMSFKVDFGLIGDLGTANYYNNPRNHTETIILAHLYPIILNAGGKVRVDISHSYTEPVSIYSYADFIHFLGVYVREVIV